MPRHIQRPAERVTLAGELRDQLVRELKSDKPFGQPIILEDQTLETDSIRVHVVWDRWQGWPHEVRTRIIEEAYAQAFGAEHAPKITLAMGSTVPEAIALGLLPFEVVPARVREATQEENQYRAAILQLEPSLLADERHPQLRYATLDDALAAMERLEEMLPGSKWIIKQELSAVGE